jgi:hypothetical protein
MSVKRLVPLHAVALSANPPDARIGDIYYNTVDDKLKYYNGTSWSDVAGVISGILEHVHTYDGAIFSVESVQVPASGVIDGGTP